ncbi:claspin-like [Atheta coriaria]|uniref:claspin-like n=1 Tax=Dalotia coriaria TaxID=877792 RepID=UPI0031F41238
MDSDSENEDDNNTDRNSEVDENIQSQPTLLNNSDQEEELPTDENPKKKTFKLIDTDSEPEADNEDNEQETLQAPIYTVNDKKELVPERNIADGLAALCDPESSDDERQIQPLAYKKKPKKKGEEPEEKRMTAKEAAEQRKEIESVSQRMLRESHVSLPYHKPKQRSLREFLQNRPKFASSVPSDISKVPAAVAIKMSREQLDFVSKKIQEREKQVAEFYKSESEEEEEESQPTCSENTETVIENSEVIEDNAEKVQKETETVDASETLKPIAINQTEETNTDENQMDVVMESNELADKPIETVEVETEENMETEINDANKTNESAAIDKDASVELQFNISDLDGGETDAVNDIVPTDEINPTKKSALQLLKDQLGDTQPKLSGAPNYVIDLEEGTTRLDEVSQLMQRFVKHTTKKPVHKKASAVELDIMCVSQGGEIHKEKVAMKIEDHEEPAIEEKPGVKYQKLRNDLQTQMAQRRNEVWKEKQARLQAEKEANADDDVYKDEREDCGIDDILDDEEEEFSNAGSDEEDEEDDADGEEEDEIEGNAGGMLANEASEDDDETEDVGDEEAEEEETKKVVKQHRRIVQPADSDSDDEEIVKPTEKNMDSTVSWPDDDDLISAGQTKSCRTPNKQSCMQTKSELGFLSPVCRLTGLQSFDATGKFLQNSPGSPAIKLSEPSPCKSPTRFSKSLFSESPMKNTQTQNLEELCSGAFPTQPTTINDTDAQPDASTQDMLELCSGNFGFTQEETPQLKSKTPDKQEVPKTVQEDLTEKENVVEIEKNTAEELPIDDDENDLISQLIDEDELATFKKKFESPLQSAYSAPDADERIAQKIAFNAINEADSEDNSDEDDEINMTVKRKKNTIMDSDDEEVAKDDLEEQIDLHDGDDDDVQDESNDEVDNPNETELGYDSEENEILVEKTQKSKKFNLKDFTEHEAELSESEWGSDDEDERHLDVMELEEGDKEQFDETELRNDLEKIHMRRILDEDKKDLKVLQELYMDEDEELKGAGRQRQFRWRNIDNVDNDESTAQDLESSITNEEECENEEEWRKKRYERELFLQSQKQNGDEEDDDTTVPLIAAKSQLFKLGQRAVINNKRNLSKATQPVQIKQTYVSKTQRGSFLSRNDEVLTRVAEYTKVSEVLIGAPKNSRNFVFHAKTTETSTSTSIEDKKRKAGEMGTPAQLKRLRLNGFSPADQKKKAESRTKARLFCNKNSNQW